jgi:lysozyme
MKKKYILYFAAGIILLIVLAVGLRYAFYQGYIRMNYPSLDEYPVQGIDISHHQGSIDWDTLDKALVQFAFIKATEGENHRDSLFAENWVQARNNGISVGAYHFFTFCRPGAIQSQNYIHTVPKNCVDLPPILDLEYGGNCKIENRVTSLIDEIAEFIRVVENHYNKRVIIYTTNEFYNNYLLNEFPDNPIWIRDILSKPRLKDGRDWTFWQYTNRGRLTGINTVVDQNVFAGGREEFEQFYTRIIHEPLIREEKDM